MINVYLTDSVIHNQHTGTTGSWEQPSTTTAVTRRARIDYKNRNIPGEDGQTVVSSAKIYLPPLTIIRSGFSSRATATIAYRDTFTFDGVPHAIAQIAKGKDFSTRYMEVYVR